jgi:hypothetical protein
VSPFAVALLVLAGLLLVAGEWHRLGARAMPDLRRPRTRPRRRGRGKPRLRVVEPDSEEFARAVERDLAALPTATAAARGARR